MTIQHAIEIIEDVKERLDEAAALNEVTPLTRQFANEDDIRESHPERWATDQLQEVIVQLLPYLGA